MFEKIKTISIKTKIILSVFFVSIILCILVSTFIYYYLLNTLSNEQIINIQKVGAIQAQTSSQIIYNEQLFAKMLGTRTRVKEFLLDRTEVRRKELLGIFSDYAKEDSNYLAIYLLDKNGIGLISTDSRFVGENYSFREYFKKAISGEPAIDLAIGKTSGTFGYYYSYPVKLNSDTVIGVLVVKVDNKKVDESILNSEIAKSSTVMLVDQYGIILSSNRPERFLKSLGDLTKSSLDIIEQTDKLLGKIIIPLQYRGAQELVDNNKSGIVNFYDYKDKETEIVSVNKFENLPFFLVSEIGMNKVYNSITSFIIEIIIIFIFGILIISFIIYRLIASFVRPINKFKTFSESINKGDFSQRIDIKSHDEFDDLAKTFNQMAVGLEDTFKTLEAKVEDRTNDLKKVLVEKSIFLDSEVKKRTEEFKKALEEKDRSLEKKIEDRTNDLKDALEETEKINKLMTGRELKMSELKKENEELKAKLEIK